MIDVTDHWLGNSASKRTETSVADDVQAKIKSDGDIL